MRLLGVGIKGLVCLGGESAFSFKTETPRGFLGRGMLMV